MGGGKTLRTVPKRKLAKTLKRNSTNLMNEYFTNEHYIVAYGSKGIGDKRVGEICDTLSNYAHILHRNFDDKSNIHNEEWAKHLMDFY